MKDNIDKRGNLNWLIIIFVFAVVLGVFSLGMIELRKSFAYVNENKPKATGIIPISLDSITPQSISLASTTVTPPIIHSCPYWFKKVDQITVKGSKKNVWMRYVMYCESGCDSGDNTSNKYFGLYNFTKTTYKGYGGTNIFDGKEQIKIVSRMYDSKLVNVAQKWPACNRAFVRDWNLSHR